MAKKATLESFKNGCTFENYLKLTNYRVLDNLGYQRAKALDKMSKVANNGYDFFKNFQEVHAKRQKPGFFSRFFNTKYNQLYKKEAKALDNMKGDLYKMGVPNDILVESHKKTDLDKYAVKNGIDDALYGITHGNKSQKVDRWARGVESINENGKTIEFEPQELINVDLDKEPINLDNEFPDNSHLEPLKEMDEKVNEPVREEQIEININND